MHHCFATCSVGAPDGPARGWRTYNVRHRSFSTELVEAKVMFGWLQVHNAAEWQEWVMGIRKDKGLGDSDVYIQVQLQTLDMLS